MFFLLTPNTGCLFQHHSNSRHQLHALQCISDTSLLESLQTPEVKGSDPRDCPTSSASWKCPGYPQFHSVSYRFAVPIPQNSGKHFTYFYWAIIKGSAIATQGGLRQGEGEGCGAPLLLWTAPSQHLCKPPAQDLSPVIRASMEISVYTRVTQSLGFGDWILSPALLPTLGLRFGLKIPTL